MEQRVNQEIWEALEQHHLPDNHAIYELSGMLSDDTEKFKAVWETLPIGLKRQLIIRCKDISEADYAVDFSTLFTIALDSNDAEICVTALEGLEESEDIRLLPSLFHLLQHGSDEIVRATTAQLLAGFVLLGELGKLQPSKFAKILTILIDIYNTPDETTEVRRRALEAVAYTGTHDVPTLIQSAYHSPEDKMVSSAVFSMGRSADKRWADIVQKELLNPGPEMRFEATRACGELQIQEAVPDLIDLSDDSDIQVQGMALWSLGQIGGARARRILEQYLQSENEALNLAAQQAIEELDFSQNGTSSFLGPPSEFSGEGEESWFSPEGFLVDSSGLSHFGDEQNSDDLLENEGFEADRVEYN